MTDQDARIAGYAWERGRALLFAVNKWDAMPREQRKPAVFREQMQWKYPTLADVPTVFLSALTGSHVADLFPALDRLVTAPPPADPDGALERSPRERRPRRRPRRA